MTDTPPELPPLPCPFCGHATAPTVISSTVWDEALGIEHDESNVPTFAVMCDATHPGGPGGCGGGGGFQETEAQAVQAWNRRALAARPAPASVEAPNWRDLLDTVVDVWLDGTKHAPEDRCYVEGTLGTVMEEARAALAASTPPAEAQPARITTADEVEALARRCGWDNRRYMTPADYAEWCSRMRMFVSLAAPPATGAPAGWQLVSVEPTEAMLSAIDMTHSCEPIDQWRAALAAAPAAAPTQEAPDWSMLNASAAPLIPKPGRPQEAPADERDTLLREAREALRDIAEAGAEAWGEERPCVRIAGEALARIDAALGDKP